MTPEKRYTLIGIIATLALPLLFYIIHISLKYSRTDTYYIVLNEPCGLTDESSINIKGLQAGNVSAINILPDARFLVELKIDKEFKIPEESALIISPVDLFGNIGIKIIPSNTTEFLDHCDTIKTIFIFEGNDFMKSLLKKQESPVTEAEEDSFIEIKKQQLKQLLKKSEAINNDTLIHE